VRIGALIDPLGSIDEVTAEVQRLAAAGFATVWGSQGFDQDTLTLLAVVGTRVPEIELGTAVVPVYPRHPSMLAQQAATVQQAIGGRLALGVGLSHQVVVERMWGYRFDRAAAYMREYLSVLAPLLAGERVDFRGEFVRSVGIGPLPNLTQPTPVYVAALGPVMLKLTGELAAGTVTWMAGVTTVGSHIVPTISAAAQAAGRPEPRVAAGLPVCVTSDVTGGKARIDTALAMYPGLPSYRAMLDREGASTPSDIALVGSEEEVAAGVTRLAEAGATDLIASVLGNEEERDRSWKLLSQLATS
jgi:F420-dependent oxidoreductase-like protein